MPLNGVPKDDIPLNCFIGVRNDYASGGDGKFILSLIKCRKIESDNFEYQVEEVKFNDRVNIHYFNDPHR